MFRRFAFHFIRSMAFYTKEENFLFEEYAKNFEILFRRLTNKILTNFDRHAMITSIHR